MKIRKGKGNEEEVLGELIREQEPRDLISVLILLNYILYFTGA